MSDGAAGLGEVRAQLFGVEGVAGGGEAMEPAGAISIVVIHGQAGAGGGVTSGQAATKTVGASLDTATKDVVAGDERTVAGWRGRGDGWGTSETLDPLVVLTESLGYESIAGSDVGVEPTRTLCIVINSHTARSLVTGGKTTVQIESAGLLSAAEDVLASAHREITSGETKVLNACSFSEVDNIANPHVEDTQGGSCMHKALV